jgi:hypothetical protein
VESGIDLAITSSVLEIRRHRDAWAHFVSDRLSVYGIALLPTLFRCRSGQTSSIAESIRR